MQLALTKKQINTSIVRIFKLVAFAGLTAVCAAIEVPFWPVPFTMQTLAIMVAGLYLGAKDGAISQILYLAAGVVLPIFSGAGFGFAAILGPTGGYLLMFPVLAFMVGFIFQNQNKFISNFLLLNVLNFGFLLVGSLWLMVVLNLSFTQAFTQGALMFMLGDTLKIATISMIAPLKKKLS